MTGDFLLYVTVFSLCFNVVRGGFQLEERERENDGGKKAVYSYPSLTKLLKGVSLTMDGKHLNLNKLDLDTAKILLKRYFSEEGLEVGLERVVRLAAVNIYIAEEDKLTPEDFDIEDLVFDETMRSLEDVYQLESDVFDSNDSLPTTSDGVGRDKRSVIIADEMRHWTNTTIHVVIPDEYTAEQKKVIAKGWKQWENGTCLKFELVDSYVGPHIRFEKGRGCGSRTGMIDSSTGQRISITNGCLDEGTIAHELGHALGFHHEQDRPDRDLYVTVFEENILKSKLSNFRRRSWAKAKTLGLPYDYTSLMHYREYQFTSNSKRTIITVDDDMHDTIGNKLKLTFFDIKMGNAHYCTDVCEGGLEWDKCENGGYRDPKNCSQCRCADGFTGQFCADVMDGVRGHCDEKHRHVTNERWWYLKSPRYESSGCRSFSSCSWLYWTDPGKRIELKVLDVRLDCWKPYACDEDYVAIRYKTNLALPGPRFCCDPPKRTFVSHGTRMLILFRVRELYKNHGVKMQYRAVNCGGCRNDSAIKEPVCLETLEVSCDGAYNTTCPDDRTKTCTLYSKNNCLKTIKKCCANYDLSGDYCIAKPVWSEWSINSTGQCSVSCGFGIATVLRTRTCSNGAGQCKGNDTDTITTKCSMKPCPVNGVWSSWTILSTDPCTLTCGGGNRSTHRHRSCTPPQFGGSDCQGPSQDVTYEACNTNSCPINGVWSSWTILSTDPCTLTCGGGNRSTHRHRSCTPPQFGGSDCQGPSQGVTYEACNTNSCPINGVWSSWTILSTDPCTLTCGGGNRSTHRHRSCTPPLFGGSDCQGPSQDVTYEACNTNSCPINGVWSSWTILSTDPCTLTCGGGNRSTHRHRSCTPPQFGGSDCQGPSQDVTYEACNTNSCPINGVWSSWTILSTDPCTLTCGGGNRSTHRHRSCTPPQFGGSDCQGPSQDVIYEACNTNSCPIDGVWSDWKVMSNGTCSLTCGGGVMETVLERICTGPRFGGKDCQGDRRKTETNPCNSQQCPEDGHWSGWKLKVSTCSVTCGQGKERITYIRTCDNPAPAHGGRACVGQDRKHIEQICVHPPCAVDGQWGAWTQRVVCSVTCGKGTSAITKERTCDHPAPKFGGKPCDGGLVQIANETGICSLGSCTVNGGWSAWEVTFSHCSVTCGLGKRTRTRQRKCDNPAPQNGGTPCPGGLLEKNTTQHLCHLHICDGETVYSMASCLRISYTPLILIVTSLLAHRL